MKKRRGSLEKSIRCCPWGIYDTQVQGSEGTILLTLHSRFSAVFVGFPGVEN